MHFSFSECPRSEDRMERFACPSPDFRGRYRCIDDRSLCDGFFDCPSREDENPDMCLFYKTVSIIDKSIAKVPKTKPFMLQFCPLETMKSFVLRSTIFRFHCITFKVYIVHLGLGNYCRLAHFKVKVNRKMKLIRFTQFQNASMKSLIFTSFHFQTKAHLDILAEALLRWARGR